MLTKLKKRIVAGVVAIVVSVGAYYFTAKTGIVVPQQLKDDVTEYTTEVITSESENKTEGEN